MLILWVIVVFVIFVGLLIKIGFINLLDFKWVVVFKILGFVVLGKIILILWCMILNFKLLNNFMINFLVLYL